MDTPSNPGSAGEHPDLAQKGAPSPLGVALKARRTERALSQRALARASGVPQSVISALETGANATAEPATVEALAGALDCAPDDLTSAPPPPEPTPAPADTPPAPQATGAQLIPHSRLKRSHLNPRKLFDDAALDDLAASLLADGILQNLLVRADPEVPGDYLVIAGERRWRSAGRNIERGHWTADHPIPCLVVEADEVKHRLLAIVENLQRVQVDPLDEAETYREMLSYGEWDTAAIAGAIGKSSRHVQLRLALLNRLDETAQQALRTGEINLAAARALTAAPLPLQRELLDRISRGDPSLRRSEDIAAQIKASLFPASRALFPLESYQGETSSDAINGETLLLDIEQARELQQAAIDRTVEKLRSRFDWVNVMRHNDWWEPGGGDRIIYAADRPDSAGADLPRGAVVRVGGNLEVKIFKDLVAVARPSSPAVSAPDDGQPSAPADNTANWQAAFPTTHTAAPAPPDPVGAVSIERRILAKRAKTRALQTALFVHPDAWMHQLILALLGCRDVCGIAAPPPRWETAVVAPEVSAVLRRFRDQLGGDDAFLPMSDEWPYLSLARDDEHSTSTTLAALALLPHLQALPADESLRLLSALTASRCSTPWIPMRPNLGDEPLVLAAATAVGADIGLSPSPIDETYLDELTADQLERLAWDIGATRDIEAFSALNKKERFRLVLDFIAANDVRHVPAEMTFGTASDIETALLSEPDDKPEEASTCTITGLPKEVPAEAIGQLAAAVARLPEFGRILLPLEARGATLSLMKQTHGEAPEIYTAASFDDGFKRVAIADAKPSHIASFIRVWLEEVQ
ncbi:ParB/RepB/Spo0J family partition protein [Azospirillum sp. Sh1]|uniref:ParB/RepB/Spo0J family partition protein n=1 Tax=Azospirillum sp. Sh1 TaxID=2607285 RepID=UPI0011EF8C44|nr:ParB/RepB/Spo0J family partition protein [Azospirillum sp. Sh1]KAA0571105.1 ParB/RepB/Spo0J family partition protein [Azospirillum sp. Sh1]